MGLQGYVWAGETAPSGADILILTFSHQGRRDTLVAISAWFRRTYPNKPLMGEG